MAKTISFMNWRETLENADVAAIGNDLILLEDKLFQPAFDYPLKMDVTAIVICAKGIAEDFINLKHIRAVAPYVIAMLPDQILEFKSMSDDFSGFMMIMSRKFSYNLLPNA